MRRLGVAIGLIVAGLSLGVQADLYRYTDERGVTVLDSRVPPEAIGRGYEVLDPQGRVKEVIPPAPTPEELEARREAERRAVADATLLRLYSSVADLDRAHARQIEQIDNQILTAQGNLQQLAKQRENLQQRAAAQERAGRAVDARILQELDELDSEQRRLNRLIERSQREKSEVNSSFEQRRLRLSTLLGD
ncbi:hypothetical protein BVH74_05300 [Halopseudomonas phragmitis]|uniref:Uncharacterized protein n=2 Tax=Halopseudomonas phragmitis TaxID=1931241 RepID=A0A1V0B350_9GAMM|nr:hypothetical protein BVH74_05300 [Halopseudomonas phragmitis]